MAAKAAKKKQARKATKKVPARQARSAPNWVKVLEDWSKSLEQRFTNLDKSVGEMLKEVRYALPTRLVRQLVDLRAALQPQYHGGSIFDPTTFDLDQDPPAQVPAPGIPAPTLAALSNPFPVLVAAELAKARAKFGNQRNGHESFGVITEEWNEFAETIFKNQPAERVVEELVQLAAMCQRAAEDVYKVPPAK